MKNILVGLEVLLLITAMVVITYDFFKKNKREEEDDDIGGFTCEPSISDLVEELKNNDPEFREAWEEKHGGTKTNG